MSNKQSVDSLLQALDSFLKNENHAQIVKTCDKILAILPNDEDIVKMKVVALLHTSDSAAAITAIEAAGVTKFPLEYAYSLYRDKRDSACIDFLKTIPDGKKSEGLWHLEAQAHYRFGSFDRAISIYETKMGPVKNMDIEAQTNLLAALTAGGQAEKAIKVYTQLGIKDKDASYELAYNLASALIETNQLQAAVDRLKIAQDVCRSTLEEDGADDAEIADEMACLLVQEGYVLQMLQQTEKARALYQAALAAKPSDAAAVMTANNNLISLRSHSGSLKRSDKILQGDDSKLSVQQRRILRANRCLLLFQGKQYDKCQELAEGLLKETPASVPITVVLAALHHKAGDAKRCEELLSACIALGPPDAVEAQLARVHFSLVDGDAQGAATLLAAQPSLQHLPATVATLTALRERLGDKDAGARLLADGVKHWAAAAAGGKDARARSLHRLLLERSAEAGAARGDKAALPMFEQLIAEYAKDAAKRRWFVARLVTAAAHTDPALASKYAGQLDTFPGLASTDVKKLEAAAAPSSDFARRLKKKEEKGAGSPLAKPAAAPDAKKPTKKRKRPVLLPKGVDPANVDPNFKPDPERWLPRWMRSSKGRRGKRYKASKDVGKGSQGAVTGSGAEINSQVSVPSTKTTAAVPAAAKYRRKKK